MWRAGTGHRHRGDRRTDRQAIDGQATGVQATGGQSVADRHQGESSEMAGFDIGAVFFAQKASFDFITIFYHLIDCKMSARLRDV